MKSSDEALIGIVLAGGKARRMGVADKCLLEIGGDSLLTRCIERLTPQTKSLILNANGDPDRFAAFNLPVISDTIEGYVGPLAGILAGMRWAAEHAPEVRHIVSAASDTPFFPLDLVERLKEAVGDDDRAIALAASRGRVHPVFGVWSVALADDLEKTLRSGERQVIAWCRTHQLYEVAFDPHQVNGQAVDPFFNINHPEELIFADDLVKQGFEDLRSNG